MAAAPRSGRPGESWLTENVARAAIVASSHGGELAIDFTLDHPDMVQQLVLVGAVVGGMPYTAHFFDRGKQVRELLGKGDMKGAIAARSNDRYLIAPGNDVARKRLFDLLTANEQDMDHPDYPLPAKPALPRLAEIRAPTLILVGDSDIADVHAISKSHQTATSEKQNPAARRGYCLPQVRRHQTLAALNA